MAEKDHGNKPELLVMLIQSIKQDPFESLMEISDPITYSLVKRYFLTGYDQNDLLQEARKVLLQAAEKYSMKESMRFLQFYHMTLSNHLNKLVRQEHTHKRKVNMDTFSLDELVEEGGQHIQGTSSVWSYPEDATLLNEMFVSFVVDLSPYEREVFLLYLERKSQREIADELGHKLIQVRSALHRCSKKLKKALS